MSDDSIQNKQLSSIQWEERPTCWISLNPQGSEVWKLLRLCRNRASDISKICGDSIFPVDLDELALYIVGKKELVFDEKSKKNMADGNMGEPFIRNWFARCIIKKPIRQIGTAIFKEDDRYSASCDGEIDDDTFIEIKFVVKMYIKLDSHAKRVKSGWTPPRFYHDHIYNNHYKQITQNGVILGKKYCWYIVVCKEDGNAYYEKVEIDPSYFWNEIYPNSDKFYATKIVPLMKKYNLKRISPPSSSTISSSNTACNSGSTSSISSSSSSSVSASSRSGSSSFDEGNSSVFRSTCNLDEYKSACEQTISKVESELRSILKIGSKESVSCPVSSSENLKS